jgi:hypothetical protein
MRLHWPCPTDKLEQFSFFADWAFADEDSMGEEMRWSTERAILFWRTGEGDPPPEGTREHAAFIEICRLEHIAEVGFDPAEPDEPI